MTEQPSAFKNPQILVAVIGAITTVIVTAIGVLPNLVTSTRPTPTVAPIIVTATPLPTTAASRTPAVTPISVSETAAPTEITVVSSSAATTEATEIPTTPTPLPVIAVPTTASAPQSDHEPNVRLIYDGVSFTLVNESGGVLSLEGVRFRSGSREWNARNWGPSIHNSIPDGKCVRLRDLAAGQRQPPAPCQNNIYGLIEVGAVAFFWRDVTSFEIIRNDVVIATCAAADGVGECEVYIG